MSKLIAHLTQFQPLVRRANGTNFFQPIQLIDKGGQIALLSGQFQNGGKQLRAHCVLKLGESGDKLITHSEFQWPHGDQFFASVTFGVGSSFITTPKA